MQTEILVIAVRRYSEDSYVGYLVGEEVLQEGGSPDEALGAMMRELWLRDSLERPVRLVFDIQSDVSFKYD